MRWRNPLLLVLLGFVAVSCDQQPVEPELQVTPAFDGATVINEITYEWPVRVTWMDSQDDWDVALLGYDPAGDNTCNDGEWVGGVPFRYHTVIQYNMKSDSFRDVLIGSMVGRQPIYMYTRASLPQTDDYAVWCDYLKNDWLAVGTWHTQSTDNDVSGDDPTPGKNSFGMVETGQLVDRDGNRYKYAWKYHCLLDPEGKDIFKCRSGVDGVVRIGNH